jgi:dihydroorotase
MELYAKAFDDAGKLDALEGFASFHGPDFYGLPRNTGKLTLVREPFRIPDELSFGQQTIVPLASGETLPWRVSI